MTQTARPLLAALVVCGAASGALAQRPDFSGDWVQVQDSASGRRSVAATGDAAFRRGDMGSGWGSPLAIRQSGIQLVVDHAFFSTYDLQPHLRYVYALDGSESRNSVMIGHATSDQRSTVTWAGDTLVISTLSPSPPGRDGASRTTLMRQALSLDPTGALVIVTSREGGSTVRTTWARR